MYDGIKFAAAGKFTSRGEWCHPDISVPTTEIVIVTDGVLNIEENGVKYSLKPDDVLFLAPNTRHRGIGMTSDKTSFYWIHISGYDEKTDRAPKKHFTLREPYHAAILCRQLLHYAEQSRHDGVSTSLLSVLLHELYIQSRPENEGDNALARKIVEWIRINSDRDITAADVASQFGYNEDYISRLLKKHYGNGLKTQINEQKMSLIGKLLLETDMPLSQIADASGFSDYKLFLKFFKYHSGMTPSKFRRVYYAVHTNNR